jgi:mRNA interferase RelE/StbE
MYAIQYTKQAIKALRKMPANEAGIIRANIRALAVDPFAVHSVRKLVGRPGYRLRAGDWPIIYEFHESEILISILKIAPRGGAYR